MIATTICERPTCKMTPDQLLGLQRHARARTASPTPETSIEDCNAVPTVIASGTQESVPIYVELAEPAPAEPLDELVAELQAKFAPPAGLATVASRANERGAFVGFALFGAWTLVEVAMLLAR